VARGGRGGGEGEWRSRQHDTLPSVQPFSQKSGTPTVARECQIGLYDPAEGDLELFCNSWSAGFLGERLYSRSPRNPALQLLLNCSKPAFAPPQRRIRDCFLTVGVTDYSHCAFICVPLKSYPAL